MARKAILILLLLMTTGCVYMFTTTPSFNGGKLVFDLDMKWRDKASNIAVYKKNPGKNEDVWIVENSSNASMKHTTYGHVPNYKVKVVVPPRQLREKEIYSVVVATKGGGFSDVDFYIDQGNVVVIPQEECR